MKHIILVIAWLATVSLVACTTTSTTPTQTVPSNTAIDSTVARTTPAIALTETNVNHAAEETEIRDLVESFGKRLQDVSLQAPDAAQEMQTQYSEFVSPALLEMWMSDVSKAPGRIVSSPWPDRIEVTALSKEGSDQYVITGFVIEVTSVEIVKSGAAAKRAVRIVVQRREGRWLITEYAEKQ